MMSNNIPDLEGLLAQMGNSDPQMQQKLQLITALMNNNSSTEDESSDQQRRIRAKKKLQRLYRDREIFQERNEDLAAALGACPDCWGKHRGCRTCRGAGTPGYFTVDKEAFTEYVMPVLEQLGLLKDDSNLIADNNIGD